MRKSGHKVEQSVWSKILKIIYIRCSVGLKQYCYVGVKLKIAS